MDMTYDGQNEFGSSRLALRVHPNVIHDVAARLNKLLAELGSELFSSSTPASFPAVCLTYPRAGSEKTLGANCLLHRDPHVNKGICGANDCGKSTSDELTSSCAMSGLTFAVVWDPDADDIVTFSAPELFELHATEPDSPSDAYDNRSQILTIGPSFLGAGVPSEFTGSHTPATLQHFRENTEFAGPLSSLCASATARGRRQDGARRRPRRSMGSTSTCAGPSSARRTTYRYASCFQVLDDFAFDPRTSFARAHLHTWMQAMQTKGLARDDVSDEGATRPGHSRDWFSMTTTSTSNFVSVENEMDDASSFALEAPNTPGPSRGRPAPPGI
ncbi:hypothetical protein GGX14DRAFT_592735 [Mycena pura]|uniref:Uncharacterized protein n=1 Tax=Mycena pura TaxID=153505 RepID=A0AAD6VWG1_9AGAR|nr:hypothetical protein GGX14DRAFT_592735 [Mycena pura]